MDKLLSPFRQNKLLNTLFLSNIFISFHYALIIYINSSLLSNFFSQTQVSALYIIGSLVDAILLLNASKVIQKIGIYTFTMLAVVIELICTIGMVATTNPTLVAIYFLVHTVTISLIMFNMDIYVETAAPSTADTGSIRATYLTVMNVMIFLAPIVVSVLVVDNNLSPVYILATVLMVPAYILLKHFKGVQEKVRKHIHLKRTVYEYIKNTDLYNVFASEFLLQLFYSFMVIYVPIYLNQYIGFSWPQIGVMFTIMLLPFVIFEVPVGELEDSKYTEKEFLTVGFIIMGLATLFISFLTVKVFWMWTAILFVSRIGASFVEVSAESYFFKRVDLEKTDVISFFRVARPMSYVVAAIIATICLQFIPFQYLFMVIGVCMILGTHYSLGLTSTKSLQK